MSHTTLYLVIRLVLVVAILLGMILVLMGINHYMLSDRKDTDEEADRLRREVEESEKVISSHSVFHKFLPRAVHSERKGR